MARLVYGILEIRSEIQEISVWYMGDQDWDMGDQCMGYGRLGVRYRRLVYGIWEIREQVMGDQ